MLQLSLFDSALSISGTTLVPQIHETCKHDDETEMRRTSGERSNDLAWLPPKPFSEVDKLIVCDLKVADDAEED
jgi:hypothetical protein